MISRNIKIGGLALVILIALSACYRLNGISISQETETFYVAQFDVNVTEGPAEIGQQFSELLKQRINNNTRLTFNDTDPDVEFEGAIVQFSVTPEAPNGNNTSDLNRLTVAVSVDYVDKLTEANSYSQRFTDFELYDAQASFADVQDGLLTDLFNRIGEEAFNKAFSNW